MTKGQEEEESVKNRKKKNHKPKHKDKKDHGKVRNSLPSVAAR